MSGAADKQEVAIFACYEKNAKAVIGLWGGLHRCVSAPGALKRKPTGRMSAVRFLSNLEELCDAK